MNWCTAYIFKNWEIHRSFRWKCQVCCYLEWGWLAISPWRVDVEHVDLEETILALSEREHRDRGFRLIDLIQTQRNHDNARKNTERSW